MKTDALRIVTLLPLLTLISCGRVRNDLDYDFAVEQTWILQDPAVQITQFESVPWRPLDSETLRRRIGEDQLVDSRSVLEIGTGTGLFAIVCAREGAKRVLALAMNRTSKACARYNVAGEHLDAVVEVALVPPWHPQSGTEAGAVADAQAALGAAVGATQRFDFVVMGTSGPLPQDLLAAATQQLPKWLTGGGCCWVICHDREVEQSVREQCRTLGFRVTAMDPAAAQAQPGVTPVYPLTLQIDPFAGNPSNPEGGAPLPVPPAQR